LSQSFSHHPQPHSLADYGWDEAYEHAFAPHRATGLIPARIARAERGSCQAVTDAGSVRAEIPGTADHGDPSSAPCTGDWAALRPAGRGRAPVLHATLERRTALVRSSSSRTSHGQVLAANVDTVVVTVSLAAPLNHGRTERMLALAWESGARPVVVLTQADACTDLRFAEEQVSGVDAGVDVLATSAVTGQGLDALTAVVSGTVVLLGPSEAGKSTLGNRLLGEDRPATGAVREADGKGRHTTSWRELLPLPGGGVLLDIPGLRAIGLHDAHSGLEQTFAEIEHLAQACRFTDCAHENEPGCAVLAAVETGEIPQRRLDSYHRLLRENAYSASRADARLRADREATKKDITRHLPVPGEPEVSNNDTPTHDHTPHTTEDETMTTWTARPETTEDIPAIRDILLAAFPTALEADIVDALRADPKAWIDGLSMVSTAPDGTVTGYALITRCHVDGAPALALAPCAVPPSAQRTAAGSAAIHAALDAARAMGENLVLVLGHADYYPRFGFTPASRFGIRAPFEVPDEAMMAIALDTNRPLPTGTIEYPVAFGV